MRLDDDDDQGDSLFDVADVPAPTGGANLAKLDASLAARGVEAIDQALAEQARTAALALDRALRGKNPAYAVAALMKPYHEVLCALGLGGVVAGAGPDDGDALGKLLEVFSAGPAAAVPDPG